MRNRGHSLVELCVGLFILVPTALILTDLVILVIGMESNDNTCREAARIAAGGDPSTVSARAMSVIDSANSNGAGFISDFRLVDVQICPSNLVAQAASLQPYGGTINGSVSVSTTVNIHPFIISWLCKGGQPFICSSAKNFPFTYVVPNAAAVINATIAPNTAAGLR